MLCTTSVSSTVILGAIAVSHMIETDINWDKVLSFSKLYNLRSICQVPSNERGFNSPQSHHDLTTNTRSSGLQGSSLIVQRHT